MNQSRLLKSLMITLAAAAGFSSGSAMATTVSCNISSAGNAGSGGTYSLDTLLGTAKLSNSSPSTELTGLDCVLGKAGVTTNLPPTITQSSGNPGAKLNGVAGQYYIDLGADTTPGYFALKFGVGNSGLPETDYFANTGALTKLVFSDAQVNALISSKGIGSLSHYAITPNGGGGDVNGGKVPEPATLTLIGLGLAGLGLVRRRHAK